MNSISIAGLRDIEVHQATSCGRKLPLYSPTQVFTPLNITHRLYLSLNLKDVKLTKSDSNPSQSEVVSVIRNTWSSRFWDPRRLTQRVNKETKQRGEHDLGP